MKIEMEMERSTEAKIIKNHIDEVESAVTQRSQKGNMVMKKKVLKEDNMPEKSNK